jgi:hypothetical protein
LLALNLTLIRFRLGVRASAVSTRSERTHNPPRENPTVTKAFPCAVATEGEQVMSGFQSTAEAPSEPSAHPKPARQQPGKTALKWLRRLHLYLGLFLFPWAVLYGVTAFLFNHPRAFEDQPTAAFGKDALAGTTLEGLPIPQAIAEDVVAKLNETQQPATPYALAGAAKFAGKEFAVAQVKADGQSLNVSIDLKTGRGTVRSSPDRERKEPEKAPFAVGRGADGRGGRAPGKRDKPSRADAGDSSSGLRLTEPLPERVKAAVPTILERTGYPSGEVTVTSVPDVVFPIEAGGRTWAATYNPMTGSVTGRPADEKPEKNLSWRQFVTGLHKAHGYPGETNGKWFWVLFADVMAITMCFWGLSGLVMWWQVKATRKTGAVVLVLSAAAATALGFAMHAAMTG